MISNSPQGFVRQRVETVWQYPARTLILNVNGGGRTPRYYHNKREVYMIIKTAGTGIKRWPLALLLLTGALQASDHADSTAAANDSIADLLDLYAFVDPFCQAQGGVGCEEGPDGLTLALTLHPGATGTTRFSSEVDYHFYIENDSGQDLQIDCSFSAEQVVSCAGLNGLSVQAPVGEIGVNGDIRVFAGLRDDPFFVDLEALQEFAQIGARRIQPARSGHVGRPERPGHRAADRCRRVPGRRPTGSQPAQVMGGFRAHRRRWDQRCNFRLLV